MVKGVWSMEQTKQRVLMFCVSFFGYEKRIADAIRDADYEVDLFDERPDNGFVAKTCVRYNIGVYRPAIRRHVESIIAANSDKDYQYVLVVKGEAINEDCVTLLRQAYPRAKFVLYLWDSVANIPDCENRMKCYDRVLTFDSEDAEKYGIPMLSLPYDKNAAGYADGREYRYDVTFVGTAHSVRPRVVKQVQRWCEENGRTCFTYFYSPHMLVYLLNKLTNPDYKWISMKEVHFEPLSAEKMNEIYASSRCVMDIEHPKQSGATTRPIEMLPMKKKVITTNPHVREFPFFNRNNFLVIDRNAPELDPDFLECPYIPVDDVILEQYAPEHFARAVLGVEE